MIASASGKARYIDIAADDQKAPHVGFAAQARKKLLNCLVLAIPGPRYGRSAQDLLAQGCGPP